MNEEVKKYYDRHSKEEDARLHYHAFELPITLKYIERYVSNGSKVFDAACGTGHYLKELLDKGYEAGGNDLSPENIKMAKKKVNDHPGLLFLHSGDALNPDMWKEDQWDAILLLGPEYHLISRKKRVELLKLAKNSVKKGGFVFTGFMSRTMAMVFGLKNNPNGIAKEHGAEELWMKGKDERFIEGTEEFNHAYFVHPEEIDQLVNSAGLHPVNLIGLEGIFGERFELYHELNDELKSKWLKFIMDHCEETPMIHNSKHLLSISKKTS